MCQIGKFLPHHVTALAEWLTVAMKNDLTHKRTGGDWGERWKMARFSHILTFFLVPWGSLDK